MFDQPVEIDDGILLPLLRLFVHHSWGSTAFLIGSPALGLRAPAFTLSLSLPLSSLSSSFIVSPSSKRWRNKPTLTRERAQLGWETEVGLHLNIEFVSINLWLPLPCLSSKRRASKCTRFLAVLLNSNMPRGTTARVGRARCRLAGR